MSRPVRTLLAAILLAALIVTGVAIAVPLIARPMIVAAVQAQSPFGDQHLDIDVECNVFSLLLGTVDRIHVRGTGLRRGDALIGAVDVTATDVSTSGGSFQGSSGKIAAVRIRLDDATELTIDSLRLSGPSSDLSGVVELDAGETQRLIQFAFDDGGVDVSGIELSDGLVGFEIFGTRTRVAIGVEDGAFVLVDPFGQGNFAIVGPHPGDGWEITNAGVSPVGLRLDVSIDGAKLLSSS
jgi:hypothetical protein